MLRIPPPQEAYIENDQLAVEVDSLAPAAFPRAAVQAKCIVALALVVCRRANQFENSNPFQEAGETWGHGVITSLIRMFFRATCIL